MSPLYTTGGATDDSVTRRESITPATMQLVLVTGAGASTLLGPPERPLPLMAAWCGLVVARLDDDVPGLTQTLGMHGGMTGEQFESLVGRFLGWTRTFPDTEQFLRVGGTNPGSIAEPVTQWMGNVKSRGTTFVRAMNDTLYEAFGAQSVDRERATVAYDKLLRALFPRGGRFRDPSRLVVATTNYDPSAEIALEELAFEVDDGRAPVHFGTPYLAPDGMVSRASEHVVPVLHLHGSVAWYRSGSRIEVIGHDKPFNPSLGEPAILMPDPSKEPDQTTGVDALWKEFQQALDRASHVFVAGHGLNDPVLVKYLRTAARRIPVAITYLVDQDGTGDSSPIHEALPDAIPVRARLGPDLFLVPEEIENWRIQGYPSATSVTASD